MTSDSTRLPLRLAATGLATIVGICPAFGEDRAVVIGIDDYSAIGAQHDLTHAVADARRFTEFLVDSWGFEPEQITRLENAEATSDAIMNTIIDKLITGTEVGDRAVLYFAGLGSRVVGGTSEPDGATEVILAHDADAFLGKMPEDVFADMLDLLEGRDVAVLFDTSHRSVKNMTAGGPGGARVRGIALEETTGTLRGIVSEEDQPIAKATFDERAFGAGKGERSIWSAAAPSQYGWETEGGGVLTSAFIEAIETRVADANGNGSITNAELLNHLNDHLSEWCEQSVDCSETGVGLLPHFDGPVGGLVGGEPNTTESDPEKTALADPHAEMLDLLTDLFSPNNAAGLKIRVDGSTPLKVGQSVQFQLRAERPGTLVLLDVNPNGELAQVFPSTLAPNDATRMQAGQILTIPSAVSVNGLPLELRVTEPAGKGVLLGLFIEDDLPTLEAILPENLGGGPVADAMGYLEKIADDLARLKSDEDGNSAVEWSAVYLPYEIVP